MAHGQVSDQSIILKVEYSKEFNEIVISANEPMLQHIQELIQDLINVKTAGRHYHLDESTGLKGNVSSLIIQRV